MLKLYFVDKPSRSYWLVGDQLTLGSDTSNDVQLSSLGVLAHHARLLISGDSIAIVPIDSAHITVNNQSVGGETSLGLDDEIRIGSERLKIANAQATLTEAPSVSTLDKQTVSASWQLHPKHPKLQSQQFLIKKKTILGRSKSADIFIPFKHLSREHVCLEPEADGLRLRDLDSANGCFVNEERVKDYLLQGGEAISFAFLDFTVEKKPAATTMLNTTSIRQAISEESIQAHLNDGAEKKAITLDSEMDSQQVESPAEQKPSFMLWIGIIIMLVIALILLGSFYEV